MASVSFGLPLAPASRMAALRRPSPASAAFNSSSASPSSAAAARKPRSRPRARIEASLKEKVVTGLAAAALTASVVMPEVAEAAAASAPGVLTPSLKNFLLSIVAGGVVFSAIAGAVIGVANFDPVKRT